MTIQIMLGPQTPHSNLKDAIDHLSVRGSIVSITAGWQDSEAELDELQNAIDRPVIDLNLYHYAEEIFARETQLRTLQRQRQDQLFELQRLYRIRLTSAMIAARKLLREKGKSDLLQLEQRAAVAQVRALDRHHVQRISAIHQSFDKRRAVLDIPAASRLQQRLAQKLTEAELVLIAGGHVAVLINRIRLFRLREILAQKPIIAWSAGTMVLGERIVLYHDDAPQGKRDAEVLDAGLGIVKKVIPLPNAKNRLDWSSRNRMALFSRRFAPAKCCTLDSNSMIRLENNRMVATDSCSVIMRTGRQKPLSVR